MWGLQGLQRWGFICRRATAWGLGDPGKGSPPRRPRSADVPGQELVQRRKAGAQPERAEIERLGLGRRRAGKGEGRRAGAGSPGSASRAAAATDFLSFLKRGREGKAGKSESKNGLALR